MTHPPVPIERFMLTKVEEIEIPLVSYSSFGVGQVLSKSEYST